MDLRGDDTTTTDPEAFKPEQLAPIAFVLGGWLVFVLLGKPISTGWLWVAAVALFGIAIPVVDRTDPNPPEWVGTVVPRFTIHDEPSFADLVLSHILILFAFAGATIVIEPGMAYILPLGLALSGLFIVLVYEVGALGLVEDL